MNMVMDYFEVSDESPPNWKKRSNSGLVQPDTFQGKKEKFECFCFWEMKTLYRKWKNSLHERYLKHSTNEERMKDIPHGLTMEDWKAMLGVFASTDFQEKSETNVKCREDLQMIYSTGFRAFAQVEYNMMDLETGDMPLTSDLWMA